VDENFCRYILPAVMLCSCTNMHKADRIFKGMEILTICFKRNRDSSYGLSCFACNARECVPISANFSFAAQYIMFRELSNITYS
jgi:hypothetical protein